MNLILMNNIHNYYWVSIICYLYFTLSLSSEERGTCSITFSFTGLACVFFTVNTWVCVNRLLLVSRPRNQEEEKEEVEKVVEEVEEEQE